MLSKKLEVRTISVHGIDDFTSFINGDATDIRPVRTPLEWWCQPQQRKQYPKLSRMALFFLSQQSHQSRRGRFLGQEEHAHGIDFASHAKLWR